MKSGQLPLADGIPGKHIDIVHGADIGLPHRGAVHRVKIQFRQKAVHQRQHKHPQEHKNQRQAENLQGKLLHQYGGEGDGGIQAQDHGHIPHTAHGDLVQKQHGLDAAQQRSGQSLLPISGRDVLKENKPVHDKVPDLRRDEQLQQIVAVKPLHVVGSLHALVQQQCPGDHEKQRHTQMAEYRCHALQQR